MEPTLELKGRAAAATSKSALTEDPRGADGDQVDHVQPTASNGHCDPNVGLIDIPQRSLPQPQVFPAVEHYLSTFNAVYPLFHPSLLWQRVNRWYEQPERRDDAAWAVLNVIVALARLSGFRPGLSLGGPLSEYVNNAQSVLSTVVLDGSDLFSVQVPLGLALLFWMDNDVDPATILLATALRSCHRMGLQNVPDETTLSPAEVLQRQRVFWLVYILDRDISMQSKIAPLQLDSDIEIDLPSFHTEGDSTGSVESIESGAQFDIFRARVQLAHVQGQVFHAIFSASGRRTPPEQKTARVSDILRALEIWHGQITADFRPAALLKVAPSKASRYMCMLFATSLQCRAQLSHGSIADTYHYSAWMASVREYSNALMAGRTLAPLLASTDWQALVREARDYMRLFVSVMLKDNLFLS